MITYRALREADLGALEHTFNPTWTSNSTLDVIKEGRDLEVTWRLVERALPQTYDKGDDYVLASGDIEDTRRRMAQENVLQVVAMQDGEIAAFLEAEHMEWNNTGWIWELLVDHRWQRQGLGSSLWARAIEWGRERDMRALMLETQSNNVPACYFYLKMGCYLCGINDAYYTNRDIRNGEVAIFWAYRL